MDFIMPLISLALSVVLAILLIKQSITRKRFLKGRLFFSFFISFVCALILVFREEIAKIEDLVNIINWIYFGIDVFIGILIVLFSGLSNSKEEFNRALFSTLDESKLYVLVDKNNKIKEISSHFLQELEAEAGDVLGKNIFAIINEKYQIYKLNDTEVNCDDLNIYYRDSSKGNGQMNLELLDDKGDTVAYYFTETPIFFLNHYRGRVFVGEKKTAEMLVGMEKNLEESSLELEMIKNRFTTILEKSKEGIFFTDLKNKTIWVNEVIVHNLCLSNNSISIEKYLSYIHPEDLAMYKAKMSTINNINPHYSISYRFNVGTRYACIREEGTRITNGYSIELCGVISFLDNNYNFEKTKTTLDTVGGEPECLDKLKTLYNKKSTFQVVYFSMANIAEINEEYGRNIGNVALSEYIKLFKYHFVDANLIYRISGLEFIAILTDYRKMEMLKARLANKEQILHVKGDYGKLSVTLHVHMGICYSSEAINEKDVLKKAKEALRFSVNPQYTANYAYYKDIK